jgi:hypothetical protein
MPRRHGPLALLTAAALLAGCFGYTRSAKGWSYVGDSLLIASGGGVIAVDRTSAPTCSGAGCPSFTAPVSGLLVAGVALAAAGVFGILFNATRPLAKHESR